MQEIDNVRARVRYNPQEDHGNVPERDALARIVMDIGVPWEVAVAIEGAEVEEAAVAAEDIRLSWRMANEYNTISESDDEEAEAEDNVAGATEAEDHDSWTTEQSRDAAESLISSTGRDDAESLSGAGSFILEPPRRRGRAREEPLEHQRWGRAPRDSREQDDESDASGEETDARQLERFEQLAGEMLEMWNGGQLLHTHGGGLTPLVQASDTDLHQAASPPPSGSVPATKAEPPARRVRFEDEPHAVPVPSTPPSPAPSPTPSPTRRWPTAPPKGMAAVAARPDPSCLPPTPDLLQAALANLQVGDAADLVTSWTAGTSGDHEQSTHDISCLLYTSDAADE